MTDNIADAQSEVHAVNVMFLRRKLSHYLTELHLGQHPMDVLVAIGLEYEYLKRIFAEAAANSDNLDDAMKELDTLTKEVATYEFNEAVKCMPKELRERLKKRSK
jgi:hypothetical protein